MTSDPAAPSIARSEVDLARLPWIRPLAVDYAQHFDKLAPFYAGNPDEPEAWRDAARRATQAPRPGARVVDVLTAQQEARGAPAAARRAAAQLRDERTVAVVTGQQAGLFGGPIYTLLKALTTIKLARQVAHDLGTPAVAVFWIDAEDHDFNEVAHCGVLDQELALRRITLRAPAGAGDRPVARVQLDEGIDAAIEELRAALPATEFTPSLLSQLGESYRRGKSMSLAFGKWLESWLGPLGLVVFDGADPATKPFVSSLFAIELAGGGVAGALAAEAGAALVERGYHAQVTSTADSVALFHVNAAREPIRRDGDQFRIGDQAVTRDELIAEATAHPEHFSPNVLLRPLAQDTIFPTIAYVAGPSELAYLGQLRGVYSRFGVPMPLIYPRATATIVDGGAARFLSRHDVPFEAFQPRDESALNRLLEAQLPAPLELAMHEADAALRTKMEAVVRTVGSVDPTLERAAASALNKMSHELHALHDKVIQAAKRRDETLRRQFVRTQAQVFPGGEPQERTVGFVWLLNRVGPALVEILDRELPLDSKRHWMMAL